MKYIKKECDSFNLHMVKTDKFKTIAIELIFSNEIEKEKITITNFLASAMTYTTKKYPTKIAFARQLEDLYAARIFPSCYRMGNNYNVDFNMNFLSDKYTEKGLFNKALDMLKEIVFNPNFTDNQLDEDTFNVTKNDENSLIERIKEDQRKKAVLKLLEHVDKDAKYALNADGYMEDLEKINRKNICEFYKEFISSSTIDLYIVGDIDFDETYKMVTEKFKFNHKKNDNKDFNIEAKKHNKKVQEFFEKDNTNQAKLCIACTLEELTSYEKNYVLNLYNTILGGSADSKFFKNIREKYSLCYYVSSVGKRLDNLLLISSGITKDNYKKMMSLIKKEMKDMKEGNFSDEDLDKAKKYYLSILEEIEDNPHQIIASYYAIDKLGAEDIEIRRDNYLKITREDIMKIAGKIFIDTAFLLGGDKK